MALNGSGAISLGGGTAGVSVNTEIGYTSTQQISFNDASVRTLTGTSANTQLTMPTNFWGKSLGYRYWELTVISASGSGQCQTTEFHFRNSANSTITQTQYAVNGSINTTNGDTNWWKNNVQDNGDHTNLDPVGSWYMRIDLGSAQGIGSGVKYVRVGGSDDSGRYMSTFKVRASSTSNFSSNVVDYGNFSAPGFNYNGAANTTIG